MIPLSEFIRDYEDHKEEIILDIMQSQHLDRKTAERGYKVSLADSVEAGIVAGDIDPDKWTSVAVQRIAMITVKEYIAEWEADKEAIIQDIMRIEKLDRTAAEKRYKVMLGTCIEAGVAIGDIIYPD